MSFTVISQLNCPVLCADVAKDFLRTPPVKTAVNQDCSFHMYLLNKKASGFGHSHI